MLRKSLVENAFDAKYVQNHDFVSKCSGNSYLKMSLMPNMYKIITVKANGGFSGYEVSGSTARHHNI